jgi:hypothetical protein
MTPRRSTEIAPQSDPVPQKVDKACIPSRHGARFDSPRRCYQRRYQTPTTASVGCPPTTVWFGQKPVASIRLCLPFLHVRNVQRKQVLHSYSPSLMGASNS